jgi:hypothetical protein
MASLEERQMAKELMIAYMEHAKPELIFNVHTVKEAQFEALWERMLRAVTGEPSK